MVVLTCIWVLLWGSASVANIASGLLVALAIVALDPGLRPRAGARDRGPLFGRPIAVLRLVAYMVLQTVQATIALTREVLGRHSMIRTGVVAVELPGCSEEMVTLVNSLVALVPGTMPLDVRMNPTVLYVHVLHLNDVAEAKRQVRRLTELCVRAFGSNEAIAAQPATPPAGKGSQ